MAYAAVASLLQTLDYLLKFPCLVFEIKKLQANKAIGWLESSGQPYRAYRHGGKDPQASTVEDIIAIRRSDTTLKLSFNSDSPKRVKVRPQILQDLSYLERYLKTYNSFELFPPVLVRVLVDDICPKIREDISFFYQVSREAKVLYQDLRFLLTNMDGYSNNWDDEGLLTSIRDAAERTRDLVEESMVDNGLESAMARLFDTVLGDNPTVSALEANAFGTEVKNAFYGNEGIRGSLVRAIVEIQCIKVKIEGIRWETRNTNNGAFSSHLLSISGRDSNEEETIVGCDDELLRILDGLTGRASRLELVTIVGMGGIGKTTLAKKLFNHPYTVYHFYCRAWITISQVYQLRDLLLGLLSSVAQRSDEMMQKSNDQLAEDLYRSLKGKKYLIVMDDLWSIDAWNHVKRCFPDDKIGSRIIVTSRSTEVANYVSPNKPPHFMNLLDAEKSWELLEKLVFGIANCPPELVEVGRQIANRCRGLPLAIVVIAGVLSRNIKAADSWKHIAENLSSVVSTDPEQCLDILALSYNYLPHNLRACFLYMGAFPEDCEIEAEKLINLWVAEGFIFSNRPNTLEKIAKDNLEDLIGRNLIFVEKSSFGGKVKSCRLHDIIRELCLREAAKENFMNVVLREGSKSFPIGVCDQRRLSFHLDPYKGVPAAPTLPQLSSFLCFTLGSHIVPDILFSQMGFKLLRVLDIYFLYFEYFPEKILILIHLRYLALNVTFELPATMSKLRNLQTFVMQGPWPRRESSSSPTLMLEYWSMPSLRHLHCSVACQLRNPPIGQEDLPRPFAPEYLQTLSTIRFSSCTKEVFSIMPGLKRLEICETIDDYSADNSCLLLKNLVYLQELETLKCCFFIQQRNIRHLPCLYCLPSNLRQLSLSWSYLPWHDMTPIARLPSLQVLKLKNYAFQGPEWVHTEEGFCSLQHLLIENTNLVHWKARVNQFPRLQNLILKSCKHLEYIPFGVEEVGSLLRIEVHYCSKSIEILAKEFQEQAEGVDVVTRRSDHSRLRRRRALSSICLWKPNFISGSCATAISAFKFLSMPEKMLTLL